MATSIHRVFWLAAILSAMAFAVSLLLPKEEKDPIHKTDGDVGEKTFMAQQTTINARNQPDSITR